MGQRNFTRATVAAVTTGVLVMMGSGAAFADGSDPVGGLLSGVDRTVHNTTGHLTGHHPTKQNAATTPSRDAPDPPVSDSDSPGHETRNPTAPDHASGHVAHAALGGQDLLDASDDKGQVNDDDSTQAHSTLLAIGGTEIIGAHAGSGGPTEDHGGLPANPLCAQTGGALCLALLYSDAYATDSGGSSDSRASSGVLDLCLGGSDPTGQTCDGGITAGLAGTDSRAHRNQTTGRTTASSASGLANVCVQRSGSTCTLSADALTSEGTADSDNGATRSSRVLALNLAGTPLGLPTDPFALVVPPPAGSIPDCAAPTTLLCVFGNQGETYVGDGLAGTSQTALDLSALGQVVQADAAQTETLAHNTGGQTVVSPPTGPNQPGQPDQPGQPNGPTHARPAAAVDDGVLPNTGGVWVGLLGIALLLFGAGGVATAWGRRPVVG